MVQKKNRTAPEITGRNGLHLSGKQRCDICQKHRYRQKQGEWIIFLDDDVLPEITGLKITDSLSRLSEWWWCREWWKVCDGLWDREVQNLDGGAFLTCHLAVEKRS